MVKGDVLEAISESLNRDGIKTLIRRQGLEGTGFFPWYDEIVIKISDSTAIGVTIKEACVWMRKFSSKELHMSSGGEAGRPFDDETTTWQHTFDLANPNDFDRVMHLIKTNVEENKDWPHTTKVK
jgi:hypothetical protein